MAVAPGTSKFADFLRKNGVSLSAAARALNVPTHVTVRNWKLGITVPEPEYRKAIEIWTNGDVVEDDWLTEKELATRERLAGVQPFTPGDAAE